MDNDLIHINDDHYEINLVAQLLNQICVVPVPHRYHYDNQQDNVMDTPIASTSTNVTASAPPFVFTH